MYFAPGFVWSIALLAVAIAAIQFLRWRKRTFRLFKNLGIDGPTPNILWGNLWEYHRKGMAHAISEWSRKYGDVFGFYNGDVPTLVVSDLDFLSYILVKNFGNFMNRGTTMPSDENHPRLSQGLLNARDVQWKRTRSRISYAFTASKFRQVFPHLDDACDRFLDGLDTKEGKEVGTYDLFKLLAAEYICRSGFGIPDRFQDEPDHPIVHMGMDVLPGIMTGPIHMIAQSTTTLRKAVAPLMWLNNKIGHFTFDRFSKAVYKAVEIRRSNPLPTGRQDILQVLLDAEDNCEEDTSGVENGYFNVKKKLSTTEISVNTGILLVAGFGTTSITLSFVCYLLAKHQSVQERVREEVKQVREKYILVNPMDLLLLDAFLLFIPTSRKGSLDYTAVTQGLKYTSRVVDETLRLLPVVVTFTTRTAREDFEYDGVRYPAGLTVMAPTMVVQKDSRSWFDPEAFDPDRFLPENISLQHGMAYQPFGQGPRNCIGKRLALVEIIYTVGRIVERFNLDLGPSQKENLELRFYSIVCEPREGPWIKFCSLPREEAQP